MEVEGAEPEDRGREAAEGGALAADTVRPIRADGARRPLLLLEVIPHLLLPLPLNLSDTQVRALSTFIVIVVPH